MHLLKSDNSHIHELLRKAESETRGNIHKEFYCTISGKLFSVPRNCSPLCCLEDLDKKKTEGDISDRLNVLLFKTPFPVRPSRGVEGFWQGRIPE